MQNTRLVGCFADYDADAAAAAVVEKDWNCEGFGAGLHFTDVAANYWAW